MYHNLLSIILGKTNKIIIPNISYQNIITSFKYFTQVLKEKYCINAFCLNAVKNDNLKYFIIFWNKNNHHEMIKLSSQFGSLKILKYLHQNGTDIHVYADLNILIACGNGHLDIVKYLHQNGANINSNNYSPIITAAKCGYLEIVKYLHQNGTDIHTYNDLAIKVANSHHHLEIVKYLSQYGAKI